MDIRATYYSTTDLSVGLNLERVGEVLDSFNPKKGLSLEDAIELYQVKLYIDHNLRLVSWSESQMINYKSLVKDFPNIICKSIYSIPRVELIHQLEDLSRKYQHSFWEIVDRFNLKNVVDENVIREIVGKNVYSLNIILENRNIVKQFGVLLTNLLKEHPEKSAEWMLSEFAEEHNPNYNHLYFPDNLTTNDRETIIITYLDSEHPNPNYIKLLLNCKSKELSLKPTTLLKAKKRNEQLSDEIFRTGSVFETQYVVELSSETGTSPKSFKMKGDQPVIVYSTEFIKDLSNSSIISYMGPLLEFVDMEGMITFTNQRPTHLDMIDLIGLKAAKSYVMNTGTRIKNQMAICQMEAYCQCLKQQGRSFEKCLSDFYKEHLEEKLGVLQGLSDKTSYDLPDYEKIKILAPVIENILQRYQAFVNYRKTSEDLLEYMPPSKIEDTPSLIKKKYVYLTNDQNNYLAGVLQLLFSDQSMLDYVEPYKDGHYGNLHRLLKAGEKVRKSDYKEYQLPKIDFLITHQILNETEDGYLRFIDEELIDTLHQLYTLGCSQFFICQPKVRQWILKEERLGHLEFNSMLLSQQEQDWLSYHWDSQFSNGLQLRNRYLHGHMGNEPAQHQDYLIMLMISGILCLKILFDLEIAKQIYKAGLREEFVR